MAIQKNTRFVTLYFLLRRSCSKSILFSAANGYVYRYSGLPLRNNQLLVFGKGRRSSPPSKKNSPSISPIVSRTTILPRDLEASARPWCPVVRTIRRSDVPSLCFSKPAKWVCHQNTPMSIGENQYGSWLFCNGNYQGLEKECLRSDMDSTKRVMFTSLFQGANNIMLSFCSYFSAI